jgi:ABC-type taurine transport system ATPase subunit
LLGDREITGPSLDRAVIFQSHALLPWLTVQGNIAFAVRSRWPAWPRAQRASTFSASSISSVSAARSRSGRRSSREA